MPVGRKDMNYEELINNLSPNRKRRVEAYLKNTVERELEEQAKEKLQFDSGLKELITENIKRIELVGTLPLPKNHSNSEYVDLIQKLLPEEYYTCLDYAVIKTHLDDYYIVTKLDSINSMSKDPIEALMNAKEFYIWVQEKYEYNKQYNCLVEKH